MAITVEYGKISDGAWTSVGEFNSLGAVPAKFVSLTATVHTGDDATRVGIWIESSHFEDVLRCMAQVDPQATLDAIAKLAGAKGVEE